MPSQQLEGIKAVLATGRPGPDTPVADQRAGYDALGTLLPLADGVATTAIDLGGVPSERHRPEGGRDDAAVLLLHGGGYAIGSLDSHRPLATHLAAASGIDVITVAYRLAPEDPFPDALDDAHAAWRALAADVPPASVGLYGDSAGGGLAIALATTLRDGGEPGPGAIAVVSPWVDLTCTADSLTRAAATDVMLDPDLIRRWAGWYAGGAPLDDPRISPLFADLEGLPPLLVHATEAEVLIDDARRLVDRATAAGVDVTAAFRPDLVHEWHILSGTPEATEDVAEVGAFLARHLR